MKFITYTSLAILLLTVGCQGNLEGVQGVDSRMDLSSSSANVFDDTGSLSFAGAVSSDNSVYDGQTIARGTSLATTITTAHKVYRGGLLILKTSAVTQHVFFEDSLSAYEVHVNDANIISVRHLETKMSSQIYLDYDYTHMLIGFKDSSLQIRRGQANGTYNIFNNGVATTGIGISKGARLKINNYIIGQLRYSDYGVSFPREEGPEVNVCPQSLTGRHISGGGRQEFTLQNPLKVGQGEHVEHFIRNESGSGDIVAVKKGGRYTAATVGSSMVSVATPPAIVLEGKASDYIVRRHPLTDHLIIENRFCGEAVNYIPGSKQTRFLFLAFKDCTAAIYNTYDTNTNEAGWRFLGSGDHKINKTGSSQVQCRSYTPSMPGSSIHEKYFGW